MLLYGDIKTSSRVVTESGMLRAPAVVARAGILEYDAASLGVGPAGTTVRVFRTLETIKHPGTVASRDRVRRVPLPREALCLAQVRRRHPLSHGVSRCHDPLALLAG